MQQLLSFSTTLKALRIAAVCTGLLLLPGCSDDQKEAASDAWDKTKEVSGDAWDKTKEVSGDAWDKTKDLASEPVVEDEQKVQIEDR